MENIKRKNKNIVFLYLSILVHFYLLFFIAYTIDKNFLDSLFHSTRPRNKESTLENIVVSTITTSKETPEKGFLSDKPNVNRGKKGDKNYYNYFNPNENETMPAKPSVTENQQKQDESRNKSDQKSHDTETREMENSPPRQPSAGQMAGDYHTSFPDPDRPPDVTMDNEGDISLATVPSEYADYLIKNVRDKISQNWNEFFPVFQYYQGIIKSGDVVVSFTVDDDGNIIDPAIVKSYGYKILDDSSFNSVIYSRNFGSLPKGLRGRGGIKINFRFIFISREEQ
jgi:TonB family protein